MGWVNVLKIKLDAARAGGGRGDEALAEPDPARERDVVLDRNLRGNGCSSSWYHQKIKKKKKYVSMINSCYIKRRSMLPPEILTCIQ